ncbi:MAG: tetratricopeptide repeat protein [Candidatus Riflebacteria bacterium]|nr:tetratricopeptide repeat protein [Candidatus Riflebacteria bacterium]
MVGERHGKPRADKSESSKSLPGNKSGKNIGNKARDAKEQKFVEKLLARVDELRQKNSPDYAARLIERVLPYFAFSTELYYALGCCEMDCGSFTAALRAFAAAGIFEPENPDVRLGIANAFLLLNWPERSLSIIKEILKTDHKHFGAHLLYGQYHEERGEWNRSLAEYRLIEDQHDHPSHPHLLARLGVCFLNIEKPLRALEYFEEALRLLPDDIETRFQRGVCFGALNEFDKALSDFEYVIEKDPLDGDALAYSALYQFYLGQKPQAVARIEKALELQPGNELISDIREEIFTSAPPDHQLPSSEDEDEDDGEEEE